MGSLRGLEQTSGKRSIGVGKIIPRQSLAAASVAFVLAALVVVGRRLRARAPISWQHVLG